VILVEKKADITDEDGRITAEAWLTGNESIFIVHPQRVCEGDFCCLHNPSDHHMRDRPLNIRSDRGDDLAERICVHGVGHPDPDSLAFIKRQDPANTWSGIHGCDGCCSP
jgi:hypothetical protein